MKTESLLAAGVLLTALSACGGGSKDAQPALAAPTGPLPQSASWVEPVSVSVATGGSVRFSVKGLPDGTSVNVAWSVAGTGCSGAGCGTIDAEGLFTAPTTVPSSRRVSVTAVSRGNAAPLGQASVDIFSPAAAAFTPTGSMVMARVRHTTTLLRDGRVLVTGGVSYSPGEDRYIPTTLRSAELYDPRSGTFSLAGAMSHARADHAAILLNDGKVLITGPAGDASAEIYDPVTDTFSAIGSLLTAQRYSQVAARLPDGKVLVAGDLDAELYDPTTGTFLSGPAYAAVVVRFEQATPLEDGRVLLLGSNPSQIYDPVTNAFTVAANLLSTSFSLPTLFAATSLLDGRVLITGGTDEMSRFSEAQLFDPATGRFSFTGRMTAIRDAHAAVRLHDGRILVLGGDGMTGNSGSGYFSGSNTSAELYDPTRGIFTAVPPMGWPRTQPGATLLQDGRVLITGGTWACEIDCFMGSLNTAELFRIEP